MMRGADRCQRQPNKALLCQVLPWEMALRALDIAVTRSVLPTTVICPLCQGNLVIVPDVRGGVWCRCWECKWAGDLIELGIKLWQLDPLSVLRKMVSRGVVMPDRILSRASVERYQADVLDYRASIRNLWENASRFPFQDIAEVSRLHDQFGLRSSHDRTRWLNQVGKFVGAAHINDVLADLKKDETCTSVIFPGTRWHHCLVIPSYDVPGRIAGYWFVGRDGRPEDWVFYWIDRARVRHGWGSPKDEHEAGLAFFDPDHIHSELFQTTSFVIGDPALALKMHGQYFRDHSDYLPLVVAYEGKEGYARTVWDSIPKRDWIFWAPNPTRELFAQARAANGRVCVLPFDETHDLRRLVTWLRNVRTAALPWREALAAQLHNLTDPQLESILLHMGLICVEDWRTFISACPEHAHGRLEACRGRQWPVRKLRMGSVVVADRPEGWFSDPGGELVSEAKIEVKATIRKQTMGKQKGWFSYHLLLCRYRGHEWYMMITPHDARDKLADDIHDYCIRNNIGVPLFSPCWRYRLLDVAMQLAEPRTLEITSRPVKRRMKKEEKILEAAASKDATDEPVECTGEPYDHSKVDHPEVSLNRRAKAPGKTRKGKK